MKLKVLVLAVTIPVAAFAIMAVVRPHTTTTWEGMQLWIDDEIARCESRDCTRPVLSGDVVPGLAREHWRLADEIAARNLSDQDLLVQYWHSMHGRAEPLVEGQVEELLARWRPALKEMRASARRTDATPDVDFGRGFEVPVRNLLGARWIANLATLEARGALEEGDAAEAVAIMLDTMTYGADFFGTGLLVEQMIGAAIVSIPVMELGDELLRQMDDAALQTLDRGLATLDEHLPVAVSLRSELVAFSSWMRNPETLEEIPLTTTWRYGFSARTMLLQAFESYCAYVEDLDTCVGVPWPARRERIAAANAALPTENQFLALAVDPTGGELNLHRLHTQLRLLRMAIALHRGVELPALEDPFGTELLEARKDGKVVILKSVGEDETSPIQRAVTLR